MLVGFHENSPAIGQAKSESLIDVATRNRLDVLDGNPESAFQRSAQPSTHQSRPAWLEHALGRELTAHAPF
jgi:hypothetical protein